jgi:demethoxyubiquinone hydroxylase (CLK1/Coq7/Cat5 family)
LIKSTDKLGFYVLPGGSEVEKFKKEIPYSRTLHTLTHTNGYPQLFFLFVVCIYHNFDHQKTLKMFRIVQNTVVCKSVFRFQLKSLSNLKNNHIRTAQAAEVFRSAFYDGQSSNTSISVSDLDELIMSENVRPSALISGFECVGKTLGFISKFIPKTYSELITNVVDDATIQHFNDSIGNIQEESQSGNDDIKETLKYHRDIHSNLDNSTVKATNVVLTAGLYKVLDLSKTI